MPPVRESLIAELELAVRDDSLENRTKTLRRVTDLFLNDADRLTDDLINMLSASRQLRVISRQTSLFYGGRWVDAAAVGLADD